MATKYNVIGLSLWFPNDHVIENRSYKKQLFHLNHVPVNFEITVEPADPKTFYREDRKQLPLVVTIDKRHMELFGGHGIGVEENLQAEQCVGLDMKVIAFYCYPFGKLDGALDNVFIKLYTDTPAEGGD